MSYQSKFIERFDIDLSQSVFDEQLEGCGRYSLTESMYSSSSSSNLSDPVLSRHNHHSMVIASTTTVEPISIPTSKYSKYRHSAIITRSVPVNSSNAYLSSPPQRNSCSSSSSISSSSSDSHNTATTVNKSSHDSLSNKFKHFLNTTFSKKKGKSNISGRNSSKSSPITSSISRAVSTKY
ncbi:MAG: hypothetical protein EXX96DRAFT_587888 [Benjaminiella poitrasii]|nr:MAG: hypothetical protein EXX96DRAFT_587888 [Benjaminiella poitrasii]